MEPQNQEERSPTEACVCVHTTSPGFRNKNTLLQIFLHWRELKLWIEPLSQVNTTYV